MTLSVAISCSDVKFSNAPSAHCAAADTCEVDPRGEKLSKNWIVPNANKQVDILFVIDNSRTMLDEQSRIRNSLGGFISFLNNAGLDWRVAITTTDNAGSDTWGNALRDTQPTEGKLVPFLRENINGNGTLAESKGQNIYYITKNTRDSVNNADAATLFQNTVYRPESYNGTGLGDERGIYSAIRNIKTKPHGFIRENAQLHVVIISDEDERSNGGMGLIGYEGKFKILEGKDRPEDLINALRALNKITRVHSIVKLPVSFNYNNFNFQACLNAHGNSGDEFVGCHYIKAAIDAGGVVGNKDVANYSSILNAIANDIEDTSLTRFTFSCVPSEVVVEQIAGYNYPNNLTSPQYLNTNGTNYYDFNPSLTEGMGVKITWTCPRN